MTLKITYNEIYDWYETYCVFQSLGFLETTQY
jgi:hypothetical protein